MKLIKLYPFFKIRKPLNFTLIRPFSTSFDFPKQKMNTDIVSLSSQQISQLYTISHYANSTTHLQKDQIDKAYTSLSHSLTEARINYPESINLQMFLLNRVSIVNKIRGMNEELVQNLEKIFFMCLSAKGEKSLDTLKHLHNYILSLILYDSQRGMSLYQFLQEEGLKLLMKREPFLLSILRLIQSENITRAIEEIEKLQVPPENEEIKENNLCWLRMQKTLQLMETSSTVNLQLEGEKILNKLLKCLLVSERKVQGQREKSQIQFLKGLQTYIEQKDKAKVPESLNCKINLRNERSQIMSMNIAYMYFYLSNYLEAERFLVLTLESAMKIYEIGRVGYGLVLLSKLNFMMAKQWEKILIDILENKESYSEGILKECLKTYSYLLEKEGRYMEAEDYIIQSEKLNEQTILEGIILPEFDFSF